MKTTLLQRASNERGHNAANGMLVPRERGGLVTRDRMQNI
jgi:hypothetical protein